MPLGQALFWTSGSAKQTVLEEEAQFSAGMCGGRPAQGAQSEAGMQDKGEEACPLEEVGEAGGGGVGEC